MKMPSCQTRRSRRVALRAWLRWPTRERSLRTWWMIQVALVFGEPLSLMWTVGKEEQEDYAEQNGRDAFDEEEPLPAAEAEVAVEVEEWACDEACDNGAEGQ